MRSKELPELVVDKLNALPARPGCYIYRDQEDHVLYVGKAVSLRNRVRSYFQRSTRHSLRIARMVARVRDIEWIVVDSELEALVLECNLIKKHRPPYNVRLRDDKSYPYITITNEKFPRVLFTRNPRRDGARYFGPYTSAWSVRDTLQALHKVFPLIPCGKSWSGRDEQRPCLYFHLGQCLAPCAGLADAQEYRKVLRNVELFLSGKEEGLLADLRKQMQGAAEELDFERAAKLRDQIGAIESVLQRQKVLYNEKTDQDVIAVVRDERGAAIQMLYVRGGKLIGQRQFFLDGSAHAAAPEAVQEFVKQYYADAPEVPREVLLPVEIEERNIVQTWLRQRRGGAVTLAVPQGGEKLKLVELAAQNAEQALATFTAEVQQREAWAEEATTQLQQALELPAPPLRIEGYDISNIQGTSPVGSMVVVENGEAAKREYRRFKIRYHPESPNDFAMMHEVITRRLRAYLDGDEKFSRLPDLILIDGGKGQLAAALKARDDLGLTVPMIGLAKRMEIVYQPVQAPSPGQLPDGWSSGEHLGAADGAVGALDMLVERAPGTPPVAPQVAGTFAEPLVPRGDALTPQPPLPPGEGGYGYREVELPLTSPGLMMLRKLRDEAHRFALTYHRKVRDKRFAGSALEEIPGVGPRRKRLLLRTFGSVEGIRRASVEDIASVPTMTRRLAEQVREYLQDQ
ncbi:MAG TPA: excinuclease ABC subunit UvrC [Fimbriimonadaceae bacterium]|nr:excinuclease ABC subunit UvrC [Fimbriimonadaceae bacterium]